MAMQLRRRVVLGVPGLDMVEAGLGLARLLVNMGADMGAMGVIRL